MAPNRVLICLPAGLAAFLLLVPGCSQDDRLAQVIDAQENGRYVETIEPLTELVGENPDDPELNFRLGLALLADQQVGMAVWPLRRAADDPSYAVQAGLELAWAAHRNGTYDDAVAAATQVLVHDPENLSAFLVRAKSHLRANREEAALEDFARMEEIDPDIPDIWMSRAMALARLGRIEEAGAQIAAIRTRVQAEAEEADPLMCALVAVFSFESGDLEGAEKTHEECLDRYPNAPVVMQRAIEFYDETERPDRGTQILRGALEADPKRIGLREQVAQRVLATGDAQEAERILREGLEHDAGPATWSALAFHYEAVKQPKQAREALSRALAQMPTVPAELRFAYADICVRAGAHEEALAQAEQLEWPAFGQMIRGRVAFEQGHYARALRDFEQAIASWPDNAGLRQLAGQAAEQLGRFDKAISDYREALRSETPGHDAGLDLARLYQALGNPRAAFTALAMHQKVNPTALEAYRVGAPLALQLGLETPAKQQLSRLRELGGKGEVASAYAEAALAGGKPNAAIQAIESAALDLGDPRNRRALRSWISALEEANRAEEAARPLSSAVGSRPNDPELLALWGDALRGSDPEGAAQAYARALELTPASAAALRGSGRLAEQRGDSARAVTLYDRALAVDPTDEQAAWSAIRIAEAEGRANEAEQRLRARLRADPRDGQAALALARLESERSPEAAVRLARRATRLRAGPEAAEVLANAQRALEKGGTASASREMNDAAEQP